MKRMIDNELLTAGKNGITVGKDLEVDGTTKLNGGLEVIAKYNFSTPDGTEWSVFDYGELNESYNNIFALRNDQGDWYIGIGNFVISDSGEYISLFALSTIDNEFEYISYNSSEDTNVNFKEVPFLEDIQPKLYMHQITLSNASGTSKRFQYITPSQVVVNSIDNLSNLLGNKDVYLDTVQVLHKTGNDWRVVGNSENFVVSSVSDIVTPLDK